MSTPQGSGSNPPHGNQAEQPTEQASWGQPPPGGWGQGGAGQSGADPDPDRTQRVDPRAWSQQVPNQQPGQGQQGGQQGQQPYGGQQGWAGGQQQAPQGGWAGQQGQQGWSGQQPPQQQPQQNPYAPPQQSWSGGQQPQPTQQWGGQQQPPQPTQQWSGQQPWNQGQQTGYAPPPDAGGSPRRRSKVPLIVGGVLVLAAIAAAVLLFWKPGFLLEKKFDEKAVAQGVTTVLTKDYGLQNVTAVTCPANTTVKAGATFTCDATIDGDASKVEIKIIDGDGKYEVGRPATS